MQIQSGFNENASHFFDSLNADFVPMNVPTVVPTVSEGWGSAGSLDQPTEQPQSPPQPPLETDRVVINPIELSSYDFLDKTHRDSIASIENAISQVEGEIMPGVHPKLLESYSQLLERRTSAIKSYTDFLTLKRKAEIEERKVRVSEKKAGMGVKGIKDNGGSGMSLNPRQLVELMRELDNSRMSEITEAEIDEEPSGKPDRSFE